MTGIWILIRYRNIWFDCVVRVVPVLRVMRVMRVVRVKEVDVIRQINWRKGSQKRFLLSYCQLKYLMSRWKFQDEWVERQVCVSSPFFLKLSECTNLPSLTSPNFITHKSPELLFVLIKSHRKFVAIKVTSSADSEWPSFVCSVTNVFHVKRELRVSREALNETPFWFAATFPPSHQEK